MADVSINKMNDVMGELRDAARELCQRYPVARDAFQVLDTRHEIMRQLNGRALVWDNLDALALQRMVACVIETVTKMGGTIQGIKWSLGWLARGVRWFSEESESLKAESEVMENESEVSDGALIERDRIFLSNASLMCKKLRPLIQRLGEVHMVVARYVDAVGVKSLLDQLQGNAREKRQAVSNLVTLMDLWTSFGDWLNQLVVLREAVVSVRERVTDLGMAIAFGIVELSEEEGDEGSADMDLDE